ncbi:MAG: acetamidase/formamidase family protein [Armatimonadetes bacterium]|nr:acetamidase/formamidase family protein [Armatimonadota bacterium]
MRRIPRTRTIPPEKRYRIFERVAEVALGESFIVKTINFRTPIIRTPKDANPAEYREREETGPIFIQGIRPGDALAVHIEAVQPVGHASGGWWSDPRVNSFLEIKEGFVRFPGGLRAPLHMMIGDIYVTPREPVPNPWDNGGNMDFRDMAPGNTLCLKAERDGGLLVLGDAHAAQGDGEILGLAAECAADMTLRITREETCLSDRPVIFKSDGFVALACRPEYAQARDLAARDASRILTRRTVRTEEEAFLYVTTVGSLRNGAVWGMGRSEPGRAQSMPLAVGVEVGWPR